MNKTCTICSEEYPATEEYFFKERRGKYGLRSKCKSCFTAESKRLKQTPKYILAAKEYRKKHYENNKEKYAERWQKYYKKNAEHLRERAVEWGRNNLDKRRISDRKRRDNPGFRLSQNMSRSIRQSLFRFNGKGRKPWEPLVGYTKKELIKHLEKQFQPGMTWENYGEWHIDHIIPILVFNFTSPDHDDFKRCWALENLQPLWAGENISKGAKIEKPFQPMLAFG